jgi:hypothetical protein
MGESGTGIDGRMYPWGNGLPNRRLANYGKMEWDNHTALEPVGSLEGGKSPYGNYDMAGNVWEWTADWYGKRYYQSSPARNPKGPESGEEKVVRGGDWFLSYSGASARHESGWPTCDGPKPPRRVPVRENSIALWCWILGPISFGRWCQDPTFRVEDSRNATVMDGRT